jgi:acetyltransferase-like isoleucine patch superfamily enzyme
MSGNHTHYDTNDPEKKRHVKTYPPVVFSGRTKIFCDPAAFIGTFSFISCMELHMEYGSQINRFVEVSGRGRLFMGENSVIGSHCTILTSSDTPEEEYMNDLSDEVVRKVVTGDIVIHKDAFIGSHCVIMPGVKIGRRAVVGANSYVSKDVPDDVVTTPVQNMRTRPRQ